MRRTALAAVCIATAATLSLTGCLPGDDDKAGSGSKEPFAGLSGGEIADRSVKATRNADSLRMKGEIEDDETGDTVRFDMALDKKGNCAGNLRMGGGKAEIIKTGGTIYMKYDEAFLRSQDEDPSSTESDPAVDLLADKWTKTSADGDINDEFNSFCDLESALEDFDNANSKAERGGTTTVDGAPAITLQEKKGKNLYTLYVATEGKPHLLRVVNKSADAPGDLTFSDYDKPVPAEAPKGKILDLDKLGT